MKREVNRIIIHCSYTPPSMDIGAETIRDWHVNDNGWTDIGYHYVIRRDGTVEDGRPVERMGAHVRGHNRDSIGICMVGGMSEEGGDDCNFTHWQWESLFDLINDLEITFGRLDIRGHREFDSNKTCPTFDVQAWVAE